MAKACINHKDAPAATMCHQCRSPVCRSCTTVTPHGSFCSSECSLRHREFGDLLRSGSPAPSKTTWALVVFGLVLAGVVGMSAIHYASTRGSLVARRIDLFGFFLQKMDSLKPDPRR